MRWNRDNDAIVLVLILALEDSWITLRDHDKLLRHVCGPI
jgi:hypothetical protein